MPVSQPLVDAIPADAWSSFAAWAAGPLVVPALARQRASDAFLDTVADLLTGFHDLPDIAPVLKAVT